MVHESCTGQPISCMTDELFLQPAFTRQALFCRDYIVTLTVMTNLRGLTLSRLRNRASV